MSKRSDGGETGDTPDPAPTFDHQTTPPPHSPAPSFCPACGHQFFTSSHAAWGNWNLDELGGVLYPGAIRLSGCENRIMSGLVRAQGNTVSRDTLISAMLGQKPEADWPEYLDQELKVYIFRLRKKIGKFWIRTQYGEGYSLRVWVPGVGTGDNPGPIVNPTAPGPTK